LAKAVEAFRNIGEVSVELGVKKHVLRFWETKFPQLKPMKRGGGRRLYRPADVELLRGIRDLLQSTGYTIKGVQKILRDQGVEHVKKLAAGAVAAAAPGSSRSAKVSEPPSLELSGRQIAALHTVIAELETCRTLLGEARRTRTGGQRMKRSA
jgi:DNA-binding transcriptional MerR regulator